MSLLKAAGFNPERTHRYYLSRLWDDKVSKIMFIGLNPSTADELEDDQTVRRLVSFSKSWGFGGFYLTNLYSFIATEPRDMIEYYEGKTKVMENRLHKKNMESVLRYGRVCSMTVFCWGASNEGSRQEDHAAKFIRTFKDAYCFGRTQGGHPKHPLFLASHTQLQKFR